MYVAAAGMVVVVQGSMEMMALSVWGGGVLLWYFGNRGGIWVVVCLEDFFEDLCPYWRNNMRFDLQGCMK